MTEKTRRIVLCIGTNCNSNGQAKAHFERIRQLLGYPNPFNHPVGIKWEVANCLDHCKEGPNLVIYPDGIWCHHMTTEELDKVIEDYIAPLVETADV